MVLVHEDLGEPVRIAINGRLYAGKVEPCFVWDRANRQIALYEYLREGENSIVLRTRMPLSSGLIGRVQKVPALGGA